MKFDFYITGTIGVVYDWWTGQKGTTADQVKTFLAGNKDKELNIAVSSFGGYLDEGIAIGEYIKAHGNCNMYIIGMTASAATVLCEKAKSVKIAKGSMMLIHNSSYMMDVWTSANKHGIDKLIEEFKKQRDDLDTFDKAIAQIYASRNGKSLEDILAKMDEEKWMLADEALEFGIVDEILDDNMLQSQSKAVKNAYATHDGLTTHFGLPDIPLEENEKLRTPSFLDRLKSIGRDIMNIVKDDEEDAPAGNGEPAQDENQTNQTNINTPMKELILNLVCALLAVKSFNLNEKNEAVLNQEQLQKIEDELKAKDDLIQQLKTEKQTAEDAKKTAEDALSNLQKEYDNFKKQAGDDTTVHPADEENKKSFASAKDLLEDINNLM